jgi:hypothetical protein
MSNELPPRLQMIFADASANLLFVKQQQWAVIRYALAAYAATYVLSQVWKAYDIRLLVAATWVVFGVSVVFLESYIHALAKFRRRIRCVYERHFPNATEARVLELSKRKNWWDREGYIWALIFASLAGAGLTTLAIWKP